MTIAVNGPGTGYGDPYLDSLIFGVRWQLGTPLNYFFASGPDSVGPHPAWTAGEEQAFRDALGLYQDITNLTFVETLDKSQANFVWDKWSNAQIGNGVLGQHDYPFVGGSQIGGDFNYQDSTWQQLQQGGDGFVTIIHEIGHGFGLEHPHDGLQKFPGVTGPFNTGALGLNQGIWTTMSYNDGWDQHPAPPAGDYGFQGTPMAFDVAAMQALYGANMSFNAGDNVYQLDSTNGVGTFWMSIWDAGGTDDTISNAGSSTDCTIDLRAATLTANDPHAGGYVSMDNGIIGGFTIANGVTIENAIGGGGNDVITGNDVANDLEGGGGNDIIDGGLGADTMTGGAGDDIYIVDNANDVINEQAGGGNDTVFSTVAYAQPAFVENLFMVGGGLVLGTSSNDTLTGDSGANTIFGLGGADRMTGLGGDDIYYVDNAGDLVIEAANAGNDTVHASISYTLGLNVENLILDGSSAIDGTGNALANTITGNAADNILDGKAGADTLIGGDGNDTFIVSGNKNYVTDVFSGGNGTLDQMHAVGTSAVALNGFDAAAASIEKWVGNGLELVGTAANEKFDLTGLTSITGLNFVDGRAGNDTLIGSNAWSGDLRGGVGSDTLHGGSLNDRLDGGKDKVADTFIFNKGDGHDTIGNLIFDKTNNVLLDDHVDLSGFGTNYTTAVHNHMTQAGTDVLIDFGGGDMLTIVKTTIAILDAHASDFHLA